ncbi:MAG: hypothetical protein ACD_23C00441G0001, partial [uncultured bacterium]
MLVALQQRASHVGLMAHGFRLFAYNEAPTFAVANDCWFR